MHDGTWQVPELKEQELGTEGGQWVLTVITTDPVQTTLRNPQS